MTASAFLVAVLLGGGQAMPVPKPQLQPQPDAELAALRAKYVGKEVWVYGGVPLHCYTKNGFSEVSGPFPEPVRVVGLQRQPGTVSRTRRVLPDLPIKNALLVQVRLPDSFKPRSWGMGGNSPQVRPLEGPNCREVLLPFADEADMLLNFSPVPPSAATKKALAPSLQKSVNPPNSLGLTHEQLLWRSGVPDEPQGNLPSLLQAPAWIWYGPPGYGDYVFRFKNDRVVKVEEPVPMP